jgi:hypothetical protein
MEEGKFLLRLIKLFIQHSKFSGFLHVVKMVDVPMDLELPGAFKAPGKRLDLLYEFVQLGELGHKRGR